jgi:membrane-anchored protein YejM (alkaline phosphatase superfamily)
MSTTAGYGRVAALLAAAGVLSVGNVGCPSGPSATAELARVFSGFECRDCNVVLLSVDTVRADFLPCYGFERNTAPRICEFAEHGLRFENAYSPAPSTVPALTAVLAGSLVANTDLDGMLAHYERQTFLAERLAARGYRRSGITDHRGFGTLKQTHQRSANLLRGFESFTNFGDGRRSSNAAKVTEAATDWLEANVSEKFFLWAHYFDPHFNWGPAPELAARFGFDPVSCDRISIGMDITEIRKLEASLTPREISCLSAMHQAELFETDRALGRVLDKLDELDLADKTLVIILSDHGEEFRERSRIGHERTVYNELVRVPLAIRNPRDDLRGRVSQNISTASLYSIILGAVDGAPIAIDPYVISRTHHNSRRTSTSEMRPDTFALVDGASKLIFTPATERLEFPSIPGRAWTVRQLSRRHGSKSVCACGSVKTQCKRTIRAPSLVRISRRPRSG